MGKVMSMMSRKVIRKVQRFNVENRAHKVISRDKPTPAPQFQSALDQLDRSRQSDPHFLEEHSKKNPELDTYLKDVYIKSHDPEMKVSAEQIEADRNRPLPQNRSTVQDLEYGVFEPANVTRGKCTLRQAMLFITNHATDPAKFTASDIAAEYRLNPETTGNILKYYRPFQLYIPEPGKGTKNIAEPIIGKIDSK